MPLKAMPFIDGTEVDYVREGLNQILNLIILKLSIPAGVARVLAFE